MPHVIMFFIKISMFEESEGEGKSKKSVSVTHLSKGLQNLVTLKTSFKVMLRQTYYPTSHNYFWKTLYLFRSVLFTKKPLYFSTPMKIYQRRFLINLRFSAMKWDLTLFITYNIELSFCIAMKWICEFSFAHYFYEMHDNLYRRDNYSSKANSYVRIKSQFSCFTLCIWYLCENWSKFSMIVIRLIDWCITCDLQNMRRLLKDKNNLISRNPRNFFVTLPRLILTFNVLILSVIPGHDFNFYSQNSQAGGKTFLVCILAAFQ